MRFVPTMCLREGMVLGKSLYGKDNTLLLMEGSAVHNNYIHVIKDLGFQGVYIVDDLSRDIVITSIISDELKYETINAVKNVYISTSEDDMKSAYENIRQTKEMVSNIVDELIENRNLIVNMIDLKCYNDYTYYHSVNVAVLSIVLGVALDLKRSQLYELGVGSLLHDIGKVFIDKDMIVKQGKLTENEYAIMKQHTKLGYDYLRDKFIIPQKSYVCSLQHHEKYDGTGYPYGLNGEKISLYGRIISITDVYDALTSDRPYRRAVLPSEAIEYIMGGSGSYFDPRLISVFTRKVAAYPTGTCVVLSNGWTGIVVENFEDCCTRPKVRLINKKNNEPEYVNLRDDFWATNITITAIANM